MSSTNRVTLAYVKENTYGVTPTSPTLQLARITGESLAQAPSFSQSEELVSDRQVTDVIRTDLEASGDVNWEFSAGKGTAGTTGPYGFPDDWLASAVGAASWSDLITKSITATFESIATSTSSFAKIKRSAGDFGADGYSVGQWIKISGADNSANNTHAKIISVSTTEMEVIPANASNDFVDESGTTNVTVDQCSQVVNGTTIDTYTLEKRFTDLTTADYEVITGAAIQGLRLRTETGAILNGSFSFLAKNASSGGISGGSDAAAATSQVLNAIDHVKAVVEGERTGAKTIDVTSVEISIENGLRGRKKVGALGPFEIAEGTFVANVTHRSHYKTKDVFDKLLNATATSLSFIVDDGSKSYVFDFPRLRYTSGRRVAGGQNQDVIAELSGQAFKHATEGITMRIGRWF